MNTASVNPNFYIAQFSLAQKILLSTCILFQLFLRPRQRYILGPRRIGRVNMGVGVGVGVVDVDVGKERGVNWAYVYEVYSTNEPNLSTKEFKNMLPFPSCFKKY